MINCGSSQEVTEQVSVESSTNTSSSTQQEVLTEKTVQGLQVGAARIAEYLPLLEGQKVALLVNQTSLIGTTHLADSLKNLGVNIQKIFAPEHGFRGTADAGEQVKDGKDIRTGIPVFSLYGKKKKPSAEDLADLDWVIFDIQDVGARFYTYISSMHYVMEACAENGVKFMVLDRPNPNGNYIDGPILEAGYQSFVGMHPVPVIHGMTVAEYAKMINGQGWLKGGIQCYLHYVTCNNYSHQTPYNLPIKPSPNLPNQRSIYLYPSLCFFEGTTVSAGRGTKQQFQIYGHPKFPAGDFQFTPVKMSGAKYPKHENKNCKGYNLTHLSPEILYNSKRLNLDYLIEFYQDFPNKEGFFLKNNFFDKLAGNTSLRKAILAGDTAEEIRATWQKSLQQYDAMRQQYLLYSL